jgi:hypothetical protein
MTNDFSNRRHKPEPQTAERAALEALEKVIGAAYEVGNVLGAGFLEKIYERALTEELGLRGLPVKAQAPFPVAYRQAHRHVRGGFSRGRPAACGSQMCGTVLE